MFTLKRLLLLLVLAVLAYCFWPRKPSLVAYNPAEMAKLQLTAAKQAAMKNWFACGVASYRIFDTQYHFPPIASVKAAIDQTRAVALFRSSADPADKEAAAKPLAQTYAEIKSQTGAKFDASAAANQQLQVWSLIEGDLPDEAAKALAGQLALVHGGDAKKYLVPARDFIAAAAAAKTSAWPAAQSSLQKAWAGLQTAAK
jgi:hypothetical protein